MPFLLRHRLHLWRAARGVHPALKRMARLTVPSVLGGAVYQINILVGTLMASLLAEGSVSYLYYADRLVEFPLGVVSMAGATAALPSMAREAALGNTAGLRETFAFAFRVVSFATIPAMAGLVLLGEPIVALLFRRGAFAAGDVRLTAQALSYYAIGLWAFATLRIAVSVFFAQQDSRTPLLAAALCLLANIAVDSSGNPHVVWYDISPGNLEIYYKKSEDGGDTWMPIQRLTWDSAASLFPDIAVVHRTICMWSGTMIGPSTPSGTWRYFTGLINNRTCWTVSRGIVDAGRALIFRGVGLPEILTSRAAL